MPSEPLELSLPWRVEYDQRFPEWHPKTNPRIVDASGHDVASVGRLTAGVHVQIDDIHARLIVSAVNAHTAVRKVAGLDWRVAVNGKHVVANSKKFHDEGSTLSYRLIPSGDNYEPYFDGFKVGPAGSMRQCMDFCDNLDRS